MAEAHGALRTQFEALVARAAELGHCAPTGSTPRELLAVLGAAGLIPDDDAPALRHDLERALYGEGLPPEAARDLERRLEQLAGRVEARGSVLPPEPEASPRVDAGRPAWLPALGLALLAAALLLAAPRMQCAPSATGVASGGTRAAGGEPDAGARWARPSENARWLTGSVPDSLGVRAPGLGLDTETGVDVNFVDAKREDPFEPPRGWSHRTEVYDRFDADGAALAVAGAVRSAEGEGDAALAAYRVRVHVFAQHGRDVPLPSPSADFEVLSWRSTPRAELRFLRDERDTLLLRSDRSAWLDVEYVVVSFSDYDRAPLPDAPFVPRELALPDALRADAERVIEHIGELRGADYAATVTRLHDYFGGFVVAPLTREERLGSAYLSLALARKGVCRHRAQAFVITARALGLPARLVTNRIHAFAEVQLPSGAWRRLEFRLPRGETDVTEWLLLGLMGVGALVALRVDQRRVERAYDAGGLQREDRSKLRAQIESNEGRQVAALARLLAVVRQRLAIEWGCDASDPDTLAAALPSAGYEPLLTRHIEQVIALSRRLAEVSASDADADPPDAATLQRAYWNTYHVLRVLDGSAPW